MDISLERIRAKIVELEAKLSDLRIVERELESLEKHSARKTRIAPGPKPKRKPEATDQAEARQTIGAAIADILGQHSALSVAEIAEYIKATGQVSATSQLGSSSLCVLDRQRERQRAGL